MLLPAREDDFTRQSLARALSDRVGEYLMLKDKIDSSLDPLDRLEQIENLVVDWDVPDWAHGWIKEGIEKGWKEGREEVLGAIRKRLYLDVGSRFDPEAVGQLTKHLDQISDPDLLLEISEKIHEGATCAALLECIKNRS